ncbi:hypothetical protein FQA39_LY04277 [Lamprigera yunnana]|nr:hypothetical protein FQA39_LY04277 [Lamprigera yunnana]
MGISADSFPKKIPRVPTKSQQQQIKITTAGKVNNRFSNKEEMEMCRVTTEYIMSRRSKKILELAAQKLRKQVDKYTSEEEAGPSNPSFHLQKQYESEEKFNNLFNSDVSIKDKTFTVPSAEISDSHGSSRNESDELDSDSDATVESADIKVIVET